MGNPSDRLLHDVDYTRYDSATGRWLALAAALVVAIVAAGSGPDRALGVGVLIGGLLAILIVVTEWDRWRAQDALHWFGERRRAEWLRDTGGEAPDGIPASEIWLGTHPRGTVPARYRVIVAEQTGDAAVRDRELAAMPSTTPGERAARLQLTMARDLDLGTPVDVDALAGAVAEMPSGEERLMLEAWLPWAVALIRRERGGKDWMAPLVAPERMAARTPLPIRRRVRLWASRLYLVIIFAVESLVLSVVGMAIT